ncbi:WYL domain-containing protein [Gracilibacillus salinarum]|uniref:WYL domain-containing protein n=1 Tax=Gracilibacillus salinarum TaxID=2932255 RepID=A0ABY4GJ81_9BACI|nr:WYL domain-containing protein [Gracilibacillus salinarum]UOQ84294.1 WYL domain-containing protein [Gracilibacillus salinarum]
MVVKKDRWYLVASRDGELRNYRVSRIHMAKVEKETFRRPLPFNLAAYWERSKAEFV